MTATIEAPTTDLGPDDVREMNAELPAYLGTFFVTVQPTAAGAPQPRPHCTSARTAP